MKKLLMITLLAISLPTLADTGPVVSQSALNYSADQSVPPVATHHHPIRTTPSPVVPANKTTNHHKHGLKHSKHKHHHPTHSNP